MDKMNKDVKRMFELGNIKRTTKKATVVGLTGLILMGNIPQVDAASRYDASNYRGKGYISKVEEVSAEGNGGYISSGKGDYGGVSYGIYQFSTVTGSAKGFVKWTKDNYPDVYKYFQDEGTTTPNTKAFNRAWTKCYKEMGMKFEKAQYDYAYKELINPAYNNVKKKYGVDLRTSRAREEYLISTAIQFGPKGICDLMDHVDVNNNMDDDELLSTLCNEKYRSVGRYKFNGCSSEVRVYARQRFIREKAELKKIAKEESGPLLDEINSDGTSDETTETKVESTSTTKTSTKDAKNKVVKEAISKYTNKNISYKMGAKDPSSGQLDCSGFVSKIANDMGADIDSYYTNAAKLCSMSEKIDRDDLQAGDLVFWHDLTGTRHNSVFHIGIYNGDGTITDCSPSHSGIGTRKLSECTNISGDKYFTFGRLDSISDNVEKEANKIVKESKEESSDSKTEDKQETVEVASSEFDDVISTDDKEIEEKADKVEEELASVKDGITSSGGLENTSEDSDESYDEFDAVIADNTEEDKSNETKDNTETKTEEKDNKDNENVDKDNEESKDNTNEEDKSNTEDNSEGLDGQLVIGDSHMEMSKDKIESDYDGAQVEAKTGSSAYVWLHDTKYWGEALLDKLPEDSDDIKGVVVSLGINNIDGITNESDVIKVLEKLQAKYPGKSIKIMKVNPVGDQYNEGSVSETNKKVDSLNKVIKDYAAKHKDVYMVDASEGLVKDGKLSKTNDGLHTNNPSKLVDNLNEAVKEADQENKDVTTEDKSTTKEDTTKKDTKDESKVEESKDTKEETKTEEKDTTKEDTSKEESKQDNSEGKSTKEETKVEDKQDKEKSTKEEVKDNTESKDKTSKDVEHKETKQEDNTSKKESKESVEKNNSNDNKIEEDKTEIDTKEESSKQDNSVESSKEEETNDTQEEKSDHTQQSQETDTKSDGDQEVEQLQSKLKSNLFGKIFLG